MRALLQQALDALETDDFLKKLEASRQIRLELDRRKWPIVHEVYEEKANSDQTVTPEFLDWLRRLYPERNGVAGNEAWNAGVAWARQESTKELSCLHGKRVSVMNQV